MKKLDDYINSHVGVTFPAAQIAIYHAGKLAHQAVFGHIDPDTRQMPITHHTRFDLASVSKLFTTCAFMTLVEQGQVELEQPVSEVLPAFCGARKIAPYPHPLIPGEVVIVAPDAHEQLVDASAITFRHLLTHTSGLPAWLPIWRMNRDVAGCREAALTCDFSYPPGARVIYSDIGLMLIGFAIEALTRQSLPEAARQRVTAPLGLSSIGYGPIAPAECAPTELYAHQPARMHGQVHDENALALGGASGHAGLFGCAADVAAFGEALRTGAALRPDTLRHMRALQAEDGDIRRGMGFMLWSPNPAVPTNPLSPDTFGHGGFTGTSLWVDPQRQLSVACLTNRVYYGRANVDTAFRLGLNRILADEFPLTTARAEAN